MALKSRVRDLDAFVKPDNVGVLELPTDLCLPFQLQELPVGQLFGVYDLGGELLPGLFLKSQH